MYQEKCSASGPSFFPNFLLGMSMTAVKPVKQQTILSTTRKEKNLYFKLEPQKNSVVVNAIYRSTLSTGAEKAETTATNGHALTQNTHCLQISGIVHGIGKSRKRLQLCPGKQVFARIHKY